MLEGFWSFKGKDSLPLFEPSERLRYEEHTKTSNWRQKCRLNFRPWKLTNTRSFSWEPDIERRLFGNPQKIARPQLRLLPQCQVVSEPTLYISLVEG
jgi:hypothetical protein